MNVSPSKNPLSAILFALILAFNLSGTQTSLSARNSKTDISRNIILFNQIYKELQTNYVDTLDATSTMRTAIDALLGQIDPYTEFYSAEEQDKLTSVSTGEYAGIGSYIMKRDSVVILSEPRWGSPARKAGVRHGDILLEIDDEVLTRDITTDKVSAKLKGQPGTSVKVKVKRPYTPAGRDSIYTIVINRGTITNDAIPYYGFIAPGIGYIDISTFSEKTATDFGDALAKLRTDNGSELKGLVIDLRGNGGGLLTSAVDVAANFLQKGTTIVTTRGREARNAKTYKTTHAPVAPTLPLVVLVDGGTASASEILSGSLQDLDRAVIIGQRSYGKGLVQLPKSLPFNSLMKITTGRYYLPSGRLIQAVDYRHRNAEGQAERIADSLTTVYNTAAGRQVRDGGGITPDIHVELPESNRLLYNIVSDFWAYDFANKVANTTVSVPDPETWEVTDTLFAQFKGFIDPARFKYDRATESGMEYLRKAVKVEGYLSPEVTAAMEALDSLLHHDLQHDLDINREEIIEILDTEIGQRWFSDAQIIKRNLRDDAYIREAINILSDPRQYGVLLAPGTEVGKVASKKEKED